MYKFGQDHSLTIRYAKWFRRRNMDFVCQTNRSINLIRWTLPSTVSAWRWTLIYPHEHTMSTAKTTTIIPFLFRSVAFHSKVVNLEVNGVSTIVAIRFTMNEHDAHPVSSGSVRFLFQCVRCVAGPRTIYYAIAVDMVRRSKFSFSAAVSHSIEAEGEIEREPTEIPLYSNECVCVVGIATNW